MITRPARSWTALASALTSAAAVTVLLAGCGTGSGTNPGESETTVNGTVDPNRPHEPMIGLPDDPDLARDEVRKRLIAEWTPLLRDSGLTYQFVYFSAGEAFVDDQYEGTMTVRFGKPSTSEWGTLEKRMDTTARANGWTQAGKSHGLKLRKGSFFLDGGCSVRGCVYSIVTSRTEQRLSYADDAQHVRTPELEQFKAPGAPAQAPSRPPE